MKKALSVSLAVVFVLFTSVTASAHRGRLDSYGGHKDNKNVSGLGSYHYHCGGYPAHLHTNGVCPYKGSPKENTSSNSATQKSKYWNGDRYWSGSNYVTGFQTIDGKTYLFDDAGYLCKNVWYTDEKNNIYLVSGDGTLSTGWQTVSNCTFYCGTDGIVKKGFCKVNNVEYYFNPISGIRHSGWLTYKGKTYYYNQNGKKVTGNRTIDGVSYKFDKNGVLQNKKKYTTTETELKWGMTMDEVIAVKKLSSFIWDGTLLYTVDKKVNTCYMFEDGILCGYGKIALANKSNLEKFQKELTDKEWLLAGSSTHDNGSAAYIYTKDGQYSSVIYMQPYVIRLKLSKTYVKSIQS